MASWSSDTAFFDARCGLRRSPIRLGNRRDRDSMLRGAIRSLPDLPSADLPTPRIAAIRLPEILVERRLLGRNDTRAA